MSELKGFTPTRPRPIHPTLGPMKEVYNELTFRQQRKLRQTYVEDTFEWVLEGWGLEEKSEPTPHRVCMLCALENHMSVCISDMSLHAECGTLVFVGSPDD